MKTLIASGGSGGHIFPALALAKELAKEKNEIIFIASARRLDKRMLQSETYKKIFLSANPMPYRFTLRWVLFSLKLISDSLYAFYILRRFRPDVVVGFGGYSAGAMVLLAAALGIRTVIHEQNVVPGRTNKFLDKFVDKIAISFPETKKYFKNKNVVFTGNPLREESLAECRSVATGKFHLDPDRKTILVMGGSQGARSLNELVSKALGALPAAEKEKLQVIHISGPRDKDRISSFYRENGISGEVFGFVDNINEAYSACDLAISRAGAAAVFELAAFAKPMVLIPYPSRKNNQHFNAKVFAGHNAAIFKDEKNLGGQELKDVIIELIDDPARQKALATNAKNLSVTDGARRLKEEVMA